MMDYKGLVRRLVHRVEQLEGKPLTPLGVRPSAVARSRNGTGTAAIRS
jgi:hypothetical protein